MHCRVVFSLALAGLAAAAISAGADDTACLSCHSAPGFSRVGPDGNKVSLRVTREELAASVHFKVGCVDCHADLRGQSIPHRPDLQQVACLACHSKPYRDAIHVDDRGSVLEDAPGCSDCHGTHGIRASDDPKSGTHRAAVIRLCGSCHRDAGQGGACSKTGRFYQGGVHASLSHKDSDGPQVVCTDCHAVHDRSPSAAGGSSTGRLRVANTCGRCHKQELADYRQSIHGRAFARGVKESPVCTDCHSEHSPPAAASAGRVADICSRCHEDLKLQKRLGLPANRLSSYRASFHGVAQKFGDTTVANCASCHGAHKVLPSTDPRSAVNKNNLPATCGKCHPGATANFAKGSIHVVPSPKQDAIVFWVRLLYMLFVVSVLGSFVAYITLDLIARATGRLPWRRRMGRT